MKVQLNTDHNIDGDERMAAWLEDLVNQHLSRFERDVTRIEAHLSDANAGKGGAQDKQCALEARISGADPVGVTHADENVDKAVRGALAKMRARLDHVLGSKHERSRIDPTVDPAAI